MYRSVFKLMSPMLPDRETCSSSSPVPASRWRRTQPLLIEPLEERFLLDGSWTTLKPMPTPRDDMPAGVVHGILHVLGGEVYKGSAGITTNEAYDPRSNTWTTKAPLPTGRITFGVGVAKDIHYAIGGNQGQYGGGLTLGTNEAYCSVTNTWTTKALMPTPRYGLAIGVVNGILYAVGGSPTANHPLATVEAYNPETDTWTPRKPMPTPRLYLGVGVENGILYAVGGITETDQLATVEAYDPTTDTWTTKTPIPTPHLQSGVAVVNGILYSVGGWDRDTNRYFDTVQAYDPRTDTWTNPGTPMTTARSGFAVGVVNNVLYAVGGANEDYSNGSPLATNEALTLTATWATLSATAGQRFAAVVASFLDSGPNPQLPNPGAATDYSAVIDGGDNSPTSTGGISVNGGGNYDVAASHTYTTAGSYTITVTISDNRDSPRMVTATSTAVVTDPAPPPGGNGSPGHLPFEQVMPVLQPVSAIGSTNAILAERLPSRGALVAEVTFSDAGAVSKNPSASTPSLLSYETAASSESLPNSVLHRFAAADRQEALGGFGWDVVDLLAISLSS
jgi:hypothetical protein